MEQQITKVRRLVEKCTTLLGGNKQLADYLGSHERTVYRWLSGETKPSANNIIAMCELVLSKKLFS